VSLIVNCISRPFTRLVAAAVATLLLSLSPTSAQASPETLQRSLGNLLQCPLDIVLAPVVAFRTLFINLRDVDDTPAVRVAYALPGYVWLTGLQAGAGALRGLTGALELVPGILLLPFEADLDALYDPADRGGALVELENPLGEMPVVEYFPLVTWHVRFGITYSSAEY
jgi:hypothetical protein